MSDKTIKVLLIEDNVGDAHFIREVLNDVMLTEAAAPKLTLTHTQTLSSGLEQIQQDAIDILLLDLSLPDSQGLDTFSQAQTQVPDIPIIVLSGFADKDLAVEAVRRGAQDYLVKGQTSGSALVRAIRYAVERKRTERLLRIQHDLAFALSATSDLDQVLNQLLASALQIEHIDCGSVYRIEQDGSFSLRAYKNLPPQFIADNRFFNAQAPQADLMMAGDSIFGACTDVLSQADRGACADIGLQAIALVPIQHAGRTLAALNLGSYTIEQFPPLVRDTIESIAGQSGSTIARVEAEESLRASEKNYRSIVESAPVGMYIYQLEDDDRLTLVEANPAADEILSIDHRALIGKSIEEAFPGLVGTEVPDAYRRVARSGEPWEIARIAYDEGEISGAFEVYTFQTEPGRMAVVFVDITNRERMEQALRREHDLVNRVMETSPISIVVLDHDGRITFANAQAERVLGLTRDKIGARTYNDPQWRITDYEGNPFPDHRLPFVQVMHGKGPVFDVRHAIERSDGKRVLLSINAAPLFDEDEQISGVVCTIKDITQQEQAEEALSKSEATLRSIFRAAPIGIGLVIDRVFQWTNEALHHMVGYSAQELLGQNARMIYPSQAEYERVGREKYQEIAERGTGSIETRFMHKDGTIIDVLLSSTPLDPADHSAGVTFTALDITERKRSEKERIELLEQIQEQAHRVQQIMDTVPEGVVLLDAGSRVILTNPWGKQYLKVLTNAENGAPISHLGHRPLAEILTSPPQGLWHEIEQGNRSFQVIARPIETGATPGGWVLVIHDVTQQRDIERRIQQQQRLAAVGQLAAGIAHDFNNIMAVIGLYAQMSLRMPDLPEKVYQRMTTIDEQSKRASALIQQIMDFSRRTILERQPMDLAPFLKEQVELLKRTLPESIQIDMACDAEEYLIKADPTHIQQVIMNLATNARDAMPEGGNLHFTLDRIQITGKDKPLPEIERGNWIRLTITDSGCGIPSDVLPHIFEPFFTTKPVGQGTGLGLAQVYGIIRQHEGHLDVDTEVGHGSSFILYLPEPSAPPMDDARPIPDHIAQGEGETILVVEDEAITREAVVSSLELLGYHVIEAQDGQEALSTFVKHSDEISLVLTDMVMPEMGGQALFHALKQLAPDAKIALMTGHPLKDDAIQELRMQGLLGWLAKPPSLEQLAQLAAQAIGERGQAAPADANEETDSKNATRGKR